MSKWRWQWSAMVTLAVLLWGGIFARGDEALVPGQIHENVACTGHPGDSYALYLPEIYDPARKWPVVYFFEPAARGKLPVEKYQAVAAEFDTILIGSNTSRNYDNAAVLQAAEAMWADSRRRLAIDPERVAFCGFSGGARVSASLAGLHGGVRGVIGFGAGYQAEDPHIRQHPFLYFAAVGVRDMNYLELKALDRKLDRLGVTHRIVTFDDDHVWPPEEIFHSALEWLQIHDIKAGRTPRDDEWLRRVYERRWREAGRLEEIDRQLAAVEEYSHLMADFEGLLDVAGAREATDRLQAGKVVQRAARRELELLQFEEEIYADLVGRFRRLRGEALTQKDLPGARKWWQKKVTELLAMSRRQKEPGKMRVAERMLSYIGLRAYEESVYYFRNGDFVRVALVEQLRLLVDPRSPHAHYDLACAFARLGETDVALTHLEQAVKNGFKRVDLLEKDDDLDNLRRLPRFERLLAGLRGE
ncbi:MAG: hypothetical protein JXQ27_09550 [Acidobacteria bacterium]|nr:hypothetical protein [Acidobacteriota bacterium]